MLNTYTYKMTCANGWTYNIESKSLRGAKTKATRLATHNCGSYAIETPEGEVHVRRQWNGFNAWGWDNWEQVVY